MIERIAFGAEHAVLDPAVPYGIEDERFVDMRISKMYRHTCHLFQNVILFSLTYYTFLG
jgi:hypothetical protein